MVGLGFSFFPDAVRISLFFQGTARKLLRHNPLSPKMTSGTAVFPLGMIF